jgi:hypothetical protein
LTGSIVSLVGWFGRQFEAPRELIDPDGEGIYLLDTFWEDAPSFPSTLMLASMLLFNNGRRWRDIDSETKWMWPGEDGNYREVSTGRFPRYWKLNLPRRWRPIHYVYCTPKQGAM